MAAVIRFTRFVLPAALLVATGAAQAAKIDVALTDARVATGQFQIALVDADGYDGKARPLAGRMLAPEGETTRLVFDDIAPGRYAVMVTHDENGNGKLDTNIVGMPTEGYGFSNNPRVMRKPTFEEAAFDVADGDVTLDIAIR